MSKISDQKRIFDWKYAVREIVLIVVGILVALGINNWNEDRKEYEKETLLLQELKVALQHDLEDIKVNTRFLERSLNSTEIILRHLENENSYHDSLKVHFGRMLGTTFFLSDDMIYQNLSNSGRDMITHDTLRNAISRLYAQDYAYIRKLEEAEQDLLISFFNPFYSLNFENHEMFSAATPDDFVSLTRNREFTAQMRWWHDLKSVTVGRYQNLETKVEKLISIIDEELMKREQV
jgi:hypothetical protein